ncbi:MAG TPA: hypothetical protein VJZ27_02465, partial [Aggregatilineales bacterium]|nr:hypothetical protein [Aggregatilineales bacterium]
MTAKFPESDSRIEKYHDGFNVEYRSDGIIIYHAYTATRDTIDAWFDVTVKHDQEHLAMGRHIRRI